MTKRTTMHFIAMLPGIVFLVVNASFAQQKQRPGSPPSVQAVPAGTYRISHLVSEEKNKIYINILSRQDVNEVAITALDKKKRIVHSETETGYTQSKRIGKYEVFVPEGTGHVYQLKVQVNGEIFYHSIKMEQHEK